MSGEFEDANGKLLERWDDDEVGSTAEYRRSRRWEETLHRTLGTRFAWTEFGDIQRCGREGTSFPELLLQRIAAQGKIGFKPPSHWDVRSVIEQLKAEDANAKHMKATYEIDAWIRTRRQQVRSEDSLKAAIKPAATTVEGEQRAVEARPSGARTLRAPPRGERHRRSRRHHPQSLAISARTTP